MQKECESMIGVTGQEATEANTESRRGTGPNSTQLARKATYAIIFAHRDHLANDTLLEGLTQGGLELSEVTHAHVHCVAHRDLHKHRVTCASAWVMTSRP